MRKFTFTGYTAADERVALVITDTTVGPDLGTYITLNWGPMTQHQLRTFLMQALSGMMQLHRDGIIHRNIHPKCVKVQMPEEEPSQRIEQDDDDDNEDIDGEGIEAAEKESKKAENGNAPKVVKFKSKVPVCKLTDYWFLHNPRKAGCKYSLGRADWGFHETAAPEVKMGAPLSTESDIWAFGICVFYWVTKGLYPNFNVDQVEDLKKHIPMKWDDWIHAVIRMCLQPNKDFRASAEDIYQFLAILKLEGDMR